MTSRVTISAPHDHAVKISARDTVTHELKPVAIVVPAGSKYEARARASQDLIIHEIQPGEYPVIEELT